MANEIGGAATDKVEDPRIAEIQAAIQSNTAGATEAITQLQDIGNRANVATSVVTNAITEAAKAASLVKRTELNANLEAQNATIRAYTATGGEAAQIDRIKAYNAIADQELAYEQEKRDIIGKEYTGIQLIDGVIGMLASVQTDLKIQEAQNVKNKISTNIAVNTNAVESASQVNNLVKETYTQGSINANLKLITQEAAVKTSEAELKGLENNATQIFRLQQMQEKQVDQLVQSYRLSNEAEAIAVRNEEVQFNRENMQRIREEWKAQTAQRAVNLELSQLNLEEIKDPLTRQQKRIQKEEAIRQIEATRKLEDQIVSSVQRAQAALGKPVEPRDLILRNSSSGGKTEEEYKLLSEMGGYENPTISDSPSGTAKNLARFYPTGNYIRNKYTNVLDTIANGLQAAAEVSETKFHSDAEREAAFDKQAEITLKTKAKNIVTGDTTNPYQAPPMEVLTSVEAVKNTALYKKVPSIQHMKETDPTRIVMYAAQGVKAGVLTPKEAMLGITAIFKTAVAKNNTLQGGFERYGMPAQDSYNAVVVLPPTKYDIFKGGSGTLTSASGLLNLFRSPEEVNTAKLDEKVGKSFAFLNITTDLTNESQVNALLVKFMGRDINLPLDANPAVQ